MAALAHARRHARAGRLDAEPRLLALFERANVPPEAVTTLVRAVHERARITLNFHPDRLLDDGSSVAAHLLAEGRYRSQFETGISNGSLTAFGGGERDEWERRLFGGAYHAPGERDVVRPVYGGLDLLHHADGACPRFGSCFFVLRPEVAERATFTWGDSHLGGEHVGTWDELHSLLAPLFDTVESRALALGRTGMTVPSLIDALTRTASLSPPPDGTTRASEAPANASVGRALDDYVEAQIHGAVSLADDVAALVVDPSFAGTVIGDTLATLAERHGLAFSCSPGFVLAPTEVPADLRGPAMIPLAAYVTERFAHEPGRLDAATIGRAAACFRSDPLAWARDYPTDEPGETLQRLKQLWHVLVATGGRAT
jgi:hypothetical protein